MRAFVLPKLNQPISKINITSEVENKDNSKLDSSKQGSYLKKKKGLHGLKEQLIKKLSKYHIQTSLSRKRLSLRMKDRTRLDKTGQDRTRQVLLKNVDII